MKKIISSLLTNLCIVGVAEAMAFAGSQNGLKTTNGFPIFTLGIILAFVINWIAFIPAYILQTEKFFDLTGSFTYISVSIICTLLSPIRDLRTLIVLALVLIWAARLGTFLFKRVHREGKDGRFDELKPNFFSFLTVWNLQGLWVALTLAAALVVMTSSNKIPLDVFAITGLAIWLIGFIIEVIADSQKSKWRSIPENRGKFINVGLWRKSQHPNYFGEITLWIGMAIISIPVLQGWQHVSLISPLFVIFLLTRISGINLLEERADKKWGGNEDYEKYKKNTPVLIPKL